LYELYFCAALFDRVYFLKFFCLVPLSPPNLEKRSKSGLNIEFV